MKQIIKTNDAPAAFGPYSQGCVTDSLIFTSGQLGVDPATGNLVQGVEAQAHAAMKNLGAILQAAGSSYEKILKTTIYVQDMADYAVVNQVYAGYFGDPNACPARTCVQVAGLPKNGLVEIDCIALR